jgi:hypothetical protein
MSDHLSLVPCSIADAKSFVGQHHRHSGVPVGALFAVAAALSGAVVGVAIIGRPIARELQDGFTAEVTRVATTGNRNACSLLYGASWRACRALGYRRLVTYTLSTEPGSSLRAAGWRVVAETRAESWNRASRPRVDRAPKQAKLRWEAQSAALIRAHKESA